MEFFMNEKRYYWLKLKDDFFKDKGIKKLRKIAGGDTYTIIYLKLQLLSLKNNGKLIFDKIEETFHEELSLEIDEDAENIKITLLFLQQVGLLEEINQNEFMLPQAVKSIGSECDSAERVRRLRENKLLLSNDTALHCNIDVTKCNTEIDIEKELKLKKDIEKHTSQPAVVSKKNEIAFTPEFEEAWSNYPKRLGSNSKAAAFKYWKARIAEGGNQLDLISAVKNYKAYAVASGNINTPYIMQAQRFFGVNKEYEQYIAINQEDLSNAATSKPSSAADKHNAVCNFLTNLTRFGTKAGTTV